MLMTTQSQKAAQAEFKPDSLYLKGQNYVIDYYVATIQYVHQLQHALRLCGIDLEIKL